MDLHTVRPVVVLLDTRTLEKLQPVVDAVAWVIRDMINDPALDELLVRRGWTAEMVAWAKLIGDMADRFTIEVGLK